MNISQLQQKLKDFNINITAREIASIWGMDETSFGAGARYYFSNCGVYGGLGLAYKYLSNSIYRKNLVCLTPELGYAFFLNKTITIEPAVYYDLSFVNCSDYSKLGFRLGFGFYF